MKTTLKVLLAIFLIAYPVIIFMGFKYLNPLSTNIFIIIILLTRLIFSKDKNNPINQITKYVIVLMVCICIAGITLKEFNLAKLYPVILNFSLFVLFIHSLRLGKTPIIESLARIRESYLPPKGIHYVRAVTKVWAIFFFLNGTFSFYSYLTFSLEAWTLYNGFISYLLIGGIFLIEYPVRLYCKKRWKGTYQINLKPKFANSELLLFKKSISDYLNVNSNFERIAISYKEANKFAGALIAVLELKREIIMLPNYQPKTIEEFRGEFDVLLSDSVDLSLFECFSKQPDTINLSLETKFTMFTSGSQGKPKKVQKTLQNLISECEALEQQFPSNLKNEVVITSVSHHHIYGLLFRILWPLIRGANISNSIIEYPEQLEKILADSNKSFTFISSPAFLKRLSADSGLNIDDINLRIFSSGGALSMKAAYIVKHYSGHFPFEIFGSTETGGIAWRTQQAKNEIWEVLPNVEISESQKCLSVNSPYILEKNFQTCDQVELITKHKFKLLGRVDRITKIEEKRLSLIELENRIKQHPNVSDAHCLVLDMGGRVIIGSLIVINRQNDWKNTPKIDRVRQLKTYLVQYFEPILLPKKYRFVEELPYNAQSKLVRSTVLGYFDEKSGN